MERNPKVSVIIPIYNVESYLSRCLTSVVKQTLSDIEIVCVNDGTTDRSVEILKPYMEMDDRIVLLEKENGGISSARNVGLDYATGDVIVFLDSDDYLEYNACERIYEAYISNYADIIIFGSKPFPELPEPEDWVPWKLDCEKAYYPEFVPAALFKERSATPFVWNHAFSRELLEREHFRFEEKISLGEDMIFLVAVMPNVQKGILFIDDKLHHYRCFRPGSSMFRYGAEKDKKLKQHVDNLRISTLYWREKGFLEKWGKEYFEWMIDFIVPDLIQFHPQNQKELARKLLQDIKECGLLDYKKKVRFETWEKYRKLEKMAR